MRRCAFFLGSLTISLFLCSSASAGVISVANASFESPTLTATGFTTSVPSWSGVSTPGFGVFFPVIGTDVNSVPDGNQVLYENAASNGGATVSQDLTTNGLGNSAIAADTTYTLDVSVGVDKSGTYETATSGFFALTPTFNESPGTFFASQNTLIGSATCGTPTSGNFILCTATFDSASAPALVGEDLGIQFSMPASGSPTQDFFDAVTVTSAADSTAPEPGTIALMMAGGLCIGIRRIRKIRNKHLPIMS